MIEERRNRASGWKHAKLSGHSNEARVKELLESSPEYLSDFLHRIGYGNETVSSISIGGLRETNVASVTGRSTKSKTDLRIYCNSGRTVNVSIKKSFDGQVYLVQAKQFIQVFEAQFGKHIPDDVQRAIKLFWAAADDAPEIIAAFGDRSDEKNFHLQMRHRSLNATTLEAYNKHLFHALRDWFAENAYELTRLSFSTGAAADENEWSEFVWYINLLGENDVDEVFPIEDICRSAAAVAEERTCYGRKNGGTTIQLPFGSVQWHQRKLEFRHSYESLDLLTTF